MIFDHKLLVYFFKKFSKITFLIQIKFRYSYCQFIHEYIALKIIKIRSELTSPTQIQKKLPTETQSICKNDMRPFIIFALHSLNKLHYVSNVAVKNASSSTSWNWVLDDILVTLILTQFLSSKSDLSENFDNFRKRRRICCFRCEQSEQAPTLTSSQPALLCVLRMSLHL